MCAQLRTDTRSQWSRVHTLWRRDRLKRSVIALYARWVRRYEIDRARHSTGQHNGLTRQAIRRFATRYAKAHGLDQGCARRAANSSLHAWSRASATLGYAVPVWSPAKPVRSLPPLLVTFAEHQRCHRGVREISIAQQCDHAAAFLQFLRARNRRVARIRLIDIDTFVIDRRRRYSVAAVANACSSLRAFCRFLHASGRTRVDLAVGIQAPCLRRGARPPRALPWSSVVQLIQAIDRRSPVGRRDYALLLLMATYGMGASEACSIRLDDIDWRAGTVRVTRPKTGVPIVLPLLAPIARALVAYLRHARPGSAQTRHLFVSMRGAHGPFLASSAVRHIVLKHARTAGLPLHGLGSHTLRHSHATRQINEGAPVAVVSDILGHRSPAVMSTYARVAIDRLRAIALPVPSWD